MIPVALFVYNRPQHTQKVVDALRENNIPLLYIFSDGPKDAADALKVEETRKALDRIDWVKKAVVKEKINKGLADSIAAGVSRVLGEHNEVIVLEDDCLPYADFYSYMCQCFKRYENEEKVFCVSAYLHPVKSSIFKGYPYDVFFWKRFWSWGWGTWRRAWEKYEPDIERLMDAVTVKGINLKKFGKDILPTVKAHRNGKINTWDVRWLLTMIVNDALSVYPVRTCIKNIGFDGSGIHCGISSKYDTRFPDIFKNAKLVFPPDINEDKKITTATVNFINMPSMRNALQLAKKFVLKNIFKSGKS